MEEIWKEIERFPYEASASGQIRRVSTGRALRPAVDKNGNRRVCLMRDGKAVSKSVPRLVFETHIRPLVGREVVAHRDGDKSHNAVGNLFATSYPRIRFEEYSQWVARALEWQEGGNPAPEPQPPPRSRRLPRGALAALRRHLAVSQSQMARALDIDPSYVSRIERGQREPSPALVERLNALIRRWQEKRE